MRGITRLPAALYGLILLGWFGLVAYVWVTGGFTVLDVPSRDAALQWAAKIASACRCAREIREFMPDPAMGN